MSNKLFRLNPLPSWIYDLETLEILDVNSTAVNHYGYSREELLSMTLKDLRPPQEVPKLINTHMGTKNLEGNIYIGTFTHQKKDGTLMQMELNGHKVDFNNRACMLVVSQDITEKLKSEEQLLQSEQRFKALVQGGADMISIIDVNGKYTYTSPTTTKILGISPEEFEGKTVFDFIHPDDIERASGYLQRIITESVVKVEPFRLRDSKNKWRWIESVLTNMLDNPVVNGIVTNSRDITKQKKEEHQLKLLSSVITNTNDAVLITEAEPFDEPGPRIIYVNEAFTKMTGYAAAEVIGKSPRILQGPNSNREELAKLSKALRNWESCEITTINYKKNGEEFWINFSVSPVADEKGWYTHWIAIERDVTEQKNKELEKELLGRISLNFSSQKDLISSSRLLCQSISDYGKFDFVEIWLPNVENTLIQLVAKTASSSNAETFYQECQDIKSFTKGEGLPGAVWKTGITLLWDEINKKDDFVRKVAAEKSLIHTTLGIPLLFNNQLVGVMLVGTRHASNYLKKHIRVFEQLEQFIGSEISRKRLEYDLTHIYDTIPDILCVADFQGRFLKMNMAGCELLGYSEEELLYHSFDEFVHPEDKGISTNEVIKLSEGESTFSFKNRYLTKSGQVVWLSWTCNSVVEEGLIYATAKNITEEKKLNELNRQTRQLAKIGSWEVDLIQQKVFWSEEVHQLHETDSQTYEPDMGSAINFYRKDFKSIVRSTIEKSISTGLPFDFEAVIVSTNKNEVWVRAIGNAEMVDGKCQRIYGSFQNIQDRKESELRLKSISNDLPGVSFQYVLYPDGTDKLLGVSKGSEKVWGLTPEQCESNINLVWDQIKKGGDYDTVVSEIMYAIEMSEQWHSKWRNICPNGMVRWHEGYGTPHIQADGTVIFNSMVFDNTDEYKAVELYDEASKMARIGSWELNLVNQENSGNMYWSTMLKEILEVDSDYNPSLTGGFEFYVGESKNKIINAVEELIQTGKGFDLELEIETAKKQIKWVRCIGKGEFVDGKCERIYGSYQDIHERKLAEIQLKTLTDNLPGVVFQYVLHPDGTDQILYINEGSHRVWSLSPEECKAHPERIWKQIEAGGNMDTMLATIQESAQNLTMWKCEWRNVSPDGTIRYYEGLGKPQRMPNGSTLWNSLVLDITERKLFEQNYLTAQADRIAILESISDAFYAIDEDWNFTYSNKEAERILKRKSEDVIGNNVWEVFYAAKGTLIEDKLKNVAKTGVAETFEYFYPGDGLWYEINAYPSKGGISVFFKNIDDRKKAEAKLQEAYEEKNSILESIGDAFFAVDKTWIVTYWNKEAELVLGRKRKEIVGKNLWEGYADAIDTDFYRQYHIAMETGEDVTFEEYYATLQKWFEVSAYPSQEGLSVYFKDVTLRKEADIRLVQANERFEKVTQATSDAIWDWDIKKDSYFRSENVLKFFGKHTSTELKERDFWSDSFHPSDLEKLKNSISSALQDKNVSRWDSEYRVYDDSGKLIYVQDRGLIIRNSEGEAIRMIGAMTDITDRKNQEEQLLALNESLQSYAAELERSNEELEQFAFITSHDLQEPLRMISSFMDLLKRRYGGQLDERALQYIHYATDGAKRMRQIILDLLDYSRAGKPIESMVLVDMNQILSDFRQLRRKVISEKSAIITNSDLPTIYSYNAAITHILYSLLDNAIKYSRPGIAPQIQIAASEHKDEWRFYIKDNGIGIEAEFLNKIFIIFQRLHNRTEFDGTGIGLSIAKKHVEFLGGKIWVESTPGEGSTFYFSLPKLNKQKTID